MDEEIHELILPLLDEENICLPLPINVVSKYWNIDLPMAEAIETAKKYAGFNGSILIEGIESAERHGLSCKIVHSSLNELKTIIDSGIPPIVLLPGIPGVVVQHASIITGYDDELKKIFHYVQKGNQEGEMQEGVIPEDIFEKQWSEEGKLLILLAPTDKLSLNLENDSFVKSNLLCFESEREHILKNYSEVMMLLKQAIEINPKNQTALYQLGTLLNEQKSPECVKYYEKCLEINNRSYLAYNGLGNFYLKTKQYEKAENNYTKAIEINPKRSATIYKNRAFLKDEQKKTDEAKDDLKNYLKYFPKAPDRGIIEQAIRER